MDAIHNQKGGEAMGKQLPNEVEEALRQKMAKKEKRLELILREQMLEDIKRKESEMIQELNERMKEKGKFLKESFNFHQENENLPSNLTAVQLNSETGDKINFTEIEERVSAEIREYERRQIEKFEDEKRRKMNKLDKEIEDLRKGQFQALCRQQELLKLQSEARLRELELLLRADGERAVKEQVDLDIAILENELRRKTEIHNRENVGNTYPPTPTSSSPTKPSSYKKRSRFQRFVDFISCKSQHNIAVKESIISQY